MARHLYLQMMQSKISAKMYTDGMDRAIQKKPWLRRKLKWMGIGAAVAFLLYVTLGRQNPAHYELLDGLVSGDKVIISGYDYFGDANELKIDN